MGSDKRDEFLQQLAKDVAEKIAAFNYRNNRCYTIDDFTRRAQGDLFRLSQLLNMEHFLPISLGGGTSAQNCLPTCKRCNVRKGKKHPDVFTPLFPADNMKRILAYFAEVGS